MPASQPIRAETDSERLHLLVDSVTEYAIYMLDTAGLVTSWNCGAERLKGYSASEIIGLAYARFFTQADRDANLPQRILATAQRQGRCEIEAWHVRKDGTAFWGQAVMHAVHDKSGRHVGFANVTRDMTDRRTAQLALAETERSFRLLVQNVVDYAIFMLDPNGVITSWNAGAERIKGYRSGEIVGQHFSRFYTREDRSAGLPARVLEEAARVGRYEAEGWRLRKDGSRFWAAVVIDAIRNETGALVGFAKITRDITERRAAQLALQEAQIRLAQAQKMEALGQVTGGVAHDFNNLLMVISGFGHTLRQRLAQDEKGLRAANAIELATKRGEVLTRQLLSFSQRLSLRPVVLNLRETFEMIRPMLTSALGSRLKLVETIAPDAWAVRLDPNEFELALINLVTNARDAMQEAGLVTLTVENIAAKPGMSADGITGDYVTVSIADTGAGISAEVLPKVFDPFFTTKGVGRGTGLGLSQVHGFVHQSGGAVTIRSDLGKGTCVTLYLPRAQTEPMNASVTTPGAGVQARDILLVEDNPEVAEATRELLESLGCHVQIATDGRAALDALEAHRFEIVLSDLVMPGGMDGLELGRAVRRKYPGLPVLLATGYSAAAQGATTEFTVLRKPYDQGELLKAMAGVYRPVQTGNGGGNVVQLRDAQHGRQAR